MEIVLKTKRQEPFISRRKNGDGVIKIDSEACDVLEGFLEKLDSRVSVRQLASAFIKAAANEAIVKTEDD